MDKDQLEFIEKENFHNEEKKKYNSDYPINEFSRNKKQRKLATVAQPNLLSNKDGDYDYAGKASEMCGLCTFLKSRGFWTYCVKLLKFVAHFVLVMLLLFFGAMVFAIVEDREDNEEGVIENSTHHNFSHLQGDASVDNYNHSTFWSEFQLKYNINLTIYSKDLLLHDIKIFIGREEQRNKLIARRKQLRDRKYIFLKWFYFVTIATTTIGYGDIYPKTDEGKLFYIFFSIIGIVLMMTLLKSCGAVLTALNKNIYRIIKRYFCKVDKFVSEELVSVILIIFTFVCFLVIGVCHDHMTNERHWSLIDCVYYWIVTLTTVGFGDITKPLEIEIGHIYDLLVYRTFGLAFLAGIIDSIMVYVKVRKKQLRKNSRKISEFGRRVIIRLAST